LLIFASNSVCKDTKLYRKIQKGEWIFPLFLAIEQDLSFPYEIEGVLKNTPFFIKKEFIQIAHPILLNFSARCKYRYTCTLH